MQWWTAQTASKRPELTRRLADGLAPPASLTIELMTENGGADRDLIQRTRDSLGRCIECGTFAQRFYELFMASSPRVAELFQKTDFERQKRMLRDSLYMMLVAAGTTKGPAHDELERLARFHRDLGVTHDMYTLWLDALIDAAREHDVHFSDELEIDWRDSLSGPVEVMKSLADG